MVWVAARHADHPSAAGAVRHKVKGDRDGEFAYVRDACVERALTCRSRSVLPRMLTRTCFALPGRLQEHPNDYSDQLLHPIARLGAQGAALKAIFKEIDRVRWPPPNRGGYLGGSGSELHGQPTIPCSVTLLWRVLSA